MSAQRKQSTVLRLLRGEDLELVSRELSVPAAELSAWPPERGWGPVPQPGGPSGGRCGRGGP